jgi:RecG-like helicase
MGLRDFLHDLTMTGAEHAAEEIRRQSDRSSGVARTEIRDRQPCVVKGTIRSVTLPARQSVPSLVAELFDGVSAVNLVWVGRRRVGGIEPGTFLVARGRVATVRGTPTIFNPSYEIVPTR